MRLARRAPGWLIAAAVGLMFACGDMRQDELDCEEAVSHLQDCCPGFNSSRIACTYETGCGTTTYPAITMAQSQCIRAESCESLVDSRVCERAQSAWPVTVGTSSAGGGPSGPAAVCP